MKPKWLLKEVTGKHFICLLMSLLSGYSSWSPSQGLTKKDFLTAKSKRWSGQTTFKKHQTGRNYMKLLTLANKLPALRKTMSETLHRNLNSSFLEVHQYYWNSDYLLGWKHREKHVTSLQNLGPVKLCKETQNVYMVTTGKKQCLVSWEGLLQCLSQQKRGVGYGKACCRSIIVWPRRPYVYHRNKSEQHWS